MKNLIIQRHPLTKEFHIFVTFSCFGLYKVYENNIGAPKILNKIGGTKLSNFTILLWQQKSLCFILGNIFLLLYCSL